MADETVVHIGENSPEQIAYKLFQNIATVEDVNLYGTERSPASREWILRTYSQCIRVVTKTARVEAVLEDTPK